MVHYATKVVGIVSIIMAFTFSQACPIKRGFVGNGLIVMPAGLSAQCELASKIRTSEFLWVEAYFVDRAQLSSIMKKLTASLFSHGYKPVSEDKQPQAYTVGYQGKEGKFIVQLGANAGKNILVLVQPR